MVRAICENLVFLTERSTIHLKCIVWSFLGGCSNLWGSNMSTWLDRVAHFWKMISSPCHYALPIVSLQTHLSQSCLLCVFFRNAFLDIKTTHFWQKGFILFVRILSVARTTKRCCIFIANIYQKSFFNIPDHWRVYLDPEESQSKQVKMLVQPTQSASSPCVLLKSPTDSLPIWGLSSKYSQTATHKQITSVLSHNETCQESNTSSWSRPRRIASSGRKAEWAR